MKVIGKRAACLIVFLVLAGCGTEEVTIPEDREYEQVLLRAMGDHGPSERVERRTISDEKSIAWLMETLSGYEGEPKGREVMSNMVEEAASKEGSYMLTFYPEDKTNVYGVLLQKDGTLIYQSRDNRRMSMVAQEKQKNVYEAITYRLDVEP